MFLGFHILPAVNGSITGLPLLYYCALPIAKNILPHIEPLRPAKVNRSWNRHCGALTILQRSSLRSPDGDAIRERVQDVKLLVVSARMIDAMIRISECYHSEKSQTVTRAIDAKHESCETSVLPLQRRTCSSQKGHRCLHSRAKSPTFCTLPVTIAVQ